MNESKEDALLRAHGYEWHVEYVPHEKIGVKIPIWSLRKGEKTWRKHEALDRIRRGDAIVDYENMMDGWSIILPQSVSRPTPAERILGKSRLFRD